MTSRRQFFAAGTGTVLAAATGKAAKTTSTPFPYTEFEARIARRDFRDMTKDVLPTPSMVVDLDLFEKNVKKLADHAKQQAFMSGRMSRFTRAWMLVSGRLRSAPLALRPPLSLNLS